jgi:hypothetical protein
VVTHSIETNGARLTISVAQQGGLVLSISRKAIEGIEADTHAAIRLTAEEAKWLEGVLVIEGEMQAGVGHAPRF